MSGAENGRELDEIERLAEAAARCLAASRERIDDLNVYPVPDGDTGTNMALTVSAVVEALEKLADTDRPTIARELTRSALMGARGNSGVILSQIVRGAAEALGESRQIDAPAVAGALRAASDAAYRGVRRPVEGTMLTVIREMAEEAEARAGPDFPLSDLLSAVLVRGEDALARTPQMLDVLRDAGVVDAGGAGLVELVRGIAAALAGKPLPPPPQRRKLSLEAVHQELSRFRYCTSFVIEGDGLDREVVEQELEELGDSLLVVGDATALKVHVHTDDPGGALSLGTSVGALAGVEIADMHAQTLKREQRLLAGAPEPSSAAISQVVAVVAGEGNRRLYQSLGTAQIVEGGQSMNPSTSEIVAAVDALDAPEAIVLPNNANVIMSAEQAAELSDRLVRVVPTQSIQAGIAAMVAYDGSRSAVENEAVMLEAIEGVATGAVTIASRDVELNGRRVREGDYLGLLEGEPVAGGESFEEVAEAIVEVLLAQPREVLTLLTGREEPELDGLVALVEERHPEIELEVQSGGQPHYALLISAE